MEANGDDVVNDDLSLGAKDVGPDRSKQKILRARRIARYWIQVLNPIVLGDDEHPVPMSRRRQSV